MLVLPTSWTYLEKLGPRLFKRPIQLESSDSEVNKSRALLFYKAGVTTEQASQVTPVIPIAEEHIQISLQIWQDLQTIPSLLPSTYVMGQYPPQDMYNLNPGGFPQCIENVAFSPGFKPRSLVSLFFRSLSMWIYVLPQVLYVLFC